MILIDGSYGEGGGQVLRSSLSLSMITGQPFKIINIRSKRKKPGLLRQHLTAVKASVKISNAQVKGAEMGSETLEFIPRQITAGEYQFSISTAGSATLVFQTIFPALVHAGGESKLSFTGGTHNPYAPPYDFLVHAFLPVMEKMGVKTSAKITQYGFYPAGGGSYTIDIDPPTQLTPIELMERGEQHSTQVRGILSKLPIKIAEKEVQLVAEAFGWSSDQTRAESVPSPGPGNALMVKLVFANIAEVFTGFGQKNVPLAKVARDTINQVQRYLKTKAPVARFLADQLLIPMVMAGKGKFITLPPSQHTLTNIEIIKKFMKIDISCQDIGDGIWEIDINRY